MVGNRVSAIVFRPIGAAILLLTAATTSHAQAPAGDKPNSVTLFAGRMTNNDWEEVATLDNVRFRRANLAGAAASRRVGNLFGQIDLELEGQLVRHFDGEQLWEFNAPVIARWKHFPWSETLPTSVAWGIGPSYTSETPPQERARNGSSQRFLVYWLAELEVGLPDEPWSALARLHHRSTGFGAVGENGGSNWIVLGFRRRF